MKKYDNYETTEAFTGDFETLAPGGYICKIKAVMMEDKPYGELMTINFDIAEGPSTGFYQRRFDEAEQKNGMGKGKWSGKYYQTVKTDDLKFFKGFITAVEKSNSGFKFDFDESKLVGKLFGGVFGQEEYMGNDMKIKVSTKCVRVRSVEEIRKGVEVPPIKVLNTAAMTQPNNNGFEPADDSNLPF